MIWSRRNFIKYSSLATIAAAVPVAAAKAATKVVGGTITSMKVDGASYTVQTMEDIERLFGKGSEMWVACRNLMKGKRNA